MYNGNYDNCNVYLALYIDDGLLLAKSKRALYEVIQVLKGNFDITDIFIGSFVGFQIVRDRINHSIFINQSTYIRKLLNRFNMSDSKLVSIPADPNSLLSLTKNESVPDINIPYREAIGSLMFLTQLTRPDISYVVNFLSRFTVCYSTEHWTALKRIFRYLQGTIDHGILYKRTEQENSLTAYSDADYAADTESRRPTSGYVFTIAGGCISWASQRQSVVALSTTESEYIAALLWQ